MTPDASVIIVTYNGRELLRECLTSLYNTEASSAEVIVVDNASSDGTVDMLASDFPSTQVVSLDVNKGFAEGNNLGVAKAGGSYLVFLNNDTIVTAGWLNTLVKTLDSHPEAAAAGSKLLLEGSPSKINSAGASIVLTGGGFDRGFLEEDSDAYNVPGEAPAVCAASMAVRKEDFEAVGGFDPMYFMYFEDVDLCWRLWLRRRKVLYVPDSVVYHKFGGSTGKERFSPLRVFYGTRNSLYNLIKNYEARNIPLPLLINMTLHTFRTLFFVLTLRPKKAWALVRAYTSLLSNLPELMKNRKDIQATRMVSDKQLFADSVILPFGDALREYRRLMNCP